MKPLSGIRILTLQNFISAPYGTMLLADLGAEVIKIEHADTGGDMSRTAVGSDLGPLDSLYYQSVNLSKRSVALDITHLKDFNPAVVCLHISGYGRSNDRAE